MFPIMFPGFWDTIFVQCMMILAIILIMYCHEQLKTNKHGLVTHTM